MTQILSGFARHPLHRPSERRSIWCLEILMGLVIWVFTSLASAQATPVPHPTLDKDKKDKQPTPAVVAPAQSPAHPAAPVYGAAVPEQTLPEPPEVVWDGKQLTIDAENSKLSDVLLAVRAKTGASVNFPAGAATSERVAVHLGPAPVREVLSSLLYGTDFDYVIQAPDDNEDGLLSVVVTERGKGDDAVVADVPEQRPGMRLMPGYSAPGKRSFQAAAEAAAEAAQAAAQADQPAPAPAPESASADADAQSPTSTPNSANASADSASSQPPTDQSPTADPGLTGGLASTRSTISSTSTSSASSSPDGSPLPQMIQDMTHLFQQRAQIQAQQNAAKTPAN